MEHEIQIGIITVSYLNDYTEHSEWLHPYYASLESQFKEENIGINHFIIQNDFKKERAKENIKSVISEYKLPFYETTFINSGLDKISGSGNHHGRALGIGLEKIGNIVSLKNFEYFLVEEFDILHDNSFLEHLKKLISFSKSYNSFIGRLYPGVNKENHCKLDGGTHIKLPRIYPHFLGFPSHLFNYMKKEGRKFESKKNNELAGEINHKLRDIFDGKRKLWIDSDTATDLFYRLVADKNFIHLNNIQNFFVHIGAISATFDNIIVKGFRDDLNYQFEKDRLNHRFEIVKRNSSHLEFPDNCVFSKSNYKQKDLKHLMGKGKKYI